MSSSIVGTMGVAAGLAVATGAVVVAVAAGAALAGPMAGIVATTRYFDEKAKRERLEHERKANKEKENKKIYKRKIDKERTLLKNEIKEFSTVLNELHKECNDNSLWELFSNSSINQELKEMKQIVSDEPDFTEMNSSDVYSNLLLLNKKRITINKELHEYSKKLKSSLTEYKNSIANITVNQDVSKQFSDVIRDVIFKEKNMVKPISEKQKEENIDKCIVLLENIEKLRSSLYLSSYLDIQLIEMKKQLVTILNDDEIYKKTEMICSLDCKIGEIGQKIDRFEKAYSEYLNLIDLSISLKCSIKVKEIGAFEEIEQLDEEISYVKKVNEEAIKNQYILTQLEEVLIELGYNVYDKNLGNKKYVDIVFKKDNESSGVRVSKFQENGQYKMMPIGIEKSDEEVDYVLDEDDNDKQTKVSRVVKSYDNNAEAIQKDFCNKYPTIIEKLKERGVVLLDNVEIDPPNSDRFLKYQSFYKKEERDSASVTSESEDDVITKRYIDK